MRSANRQVGPISMAFLAAGTVVTLAATAFMAAAELIPAQVFPAPRESGESPVRVPDLMMAAAGGGVFIIDTLTGLRAPSPQGETGNPNPDQLDHPESYADWQKEVKEKIQPRKDYWSELQTAVGGQENLEKMVKLILTDRNYPYYAYGLFLGLAMFFSALAIQAVGRHDAEEITVLPAKK